MYPSHVAVDRVLADEDQVRETLADSTPGVFDGEERLERLHRVLYPVFRARYTYDGDGGFFGTDTHEGTCLIDGL